MHAAEEWAEELGLGPNELVMLSTVERTGDHLFVEPTEATTPTVSENLTLKASM